MPHVSDPKKHFNFTVRIAGLNEWLAQKVTTPDWEIDVVEHGDSNHIIKTGGLAKFGNLMIEKISPATISDRFIWDWINQVQNVLLGGGALPSIYKRTGEIIHFSTDNITPIDIWSYQGLWPCKINGIELARATSENTIESIEFCLDKPIKVL